MDKLTDELFNELSNTLLKTKENVENKFLEKDNHIVSLKEELAKAYSTIDGLNDKMTKITSENDEISKRMELLKSEYKEKINNNESELAQPIMSDKIIYGISNLEKRKEESIFDSINFFNKCCPYCGNSLYDGHIRSKIEIDHFFPISKGGQDLPWNILPICKNCNRKKRDKMPYDFLETEKYQQCYSYLVNIKNSYSNNIKDELSNLEIIKNIIKNSELDLNKYKHIHILREIINVISPELFKSNLNESDEDFHQKDIESSLKIVTDFFSIISRKPVDDFFQYHNKNEEIRINISHAYEQYLKIMKNTSERIKENQIKKILLNNIPGLIEKSKVLTINYKSIRCVIYDYNSMPDEWKDVFNILRNIE